MNQYKIVYRHNGGRFRVFVDAQTLEKAIAEFRRKSAFSLVLIQEVVFVKAYPLDEKEWEQLNRWFIKIFGVSVKPKIKESNEQKL
ncbi:hypothetical protein GCM10011514_16960 [Emticicia aquatilis]|uniref:Uncharacterized protein n=1 Tax=Emticicia aquatilis TaxID=1537369 RepID=A0A916YN94_9BACT|nr:hypothetical protein [Emticicia aquatilis]GGD53444.1 hypothetical protein GCM10011514_16960 [Emticicia aquatilis]